MIDAGVLALPPAPRASDHALTSGTLPIRGPVAASEPIAAPVFAEPELAVTSDDAGAPLPAPAAPEIADEAAPTPMPRAVVGLPTLGLPSSSALQLQPNVSVNYSTHVAPPPASQRKAMFLSRPTEDQAVPPRASHFHRASQRSNHQAIEGFSGEELPPPAPRPVPPPIPRPPSAGPADDSDPWHFGEEPLTEESFLWRLRQRAAREGELFDLEVLESEVPNGEPYGSGIAGGIGGESILDRRIIADDLPEDYLHSGALRRRTVAGFAELVRRGFDRVWSTRQRVDAGLGLVLVEHAPLVLDTTQPRNQVRFRGDFGYGIEFPDRSEYFWASPPRGPGYQGEIDYREFAFMFEVGGDAFSLQTEIPVRGYSPQFGDGHTAVGDIRITQKLRLVAGEQVQVTQMLRVHTPTGNTRVGAGTGHTAIEPGGLFRYKYNDWTYLHAELKYWIPLGGDPIHSGDVLSYGFGVSTVWYETLTTAVMPTLELTSINFLTGQKTGPLDPLGPVVPQWVSRDATAALHPGIRYAWDPGGDLGTMELGVSSGFAISRDRHYDSLLRLELRLIR